MQRGRQSLRRESDGPLAGAGYAVKERMARPRAVYGGAVDFGLGGRFRSKDQARASMSAPFPSDGASIEATAGPGGRGTSTGSG